MLQHIKCHSRESDDEEQNQESKDRFDNHIGISPITAANKITQI